MIMIALAAALAAAPADPGNWRTYSNVRFGYAICYPAMLRPRREADNGDGRSFEAADGAKLLVFGSNVAGSGGAAAAMEEEAGEITSRGGAVTYRSLHHDWAVISGHEAGQYFYMKRIARADQLLTFEFYYPMKRSAEYRPVVERIARCFTAGKPAF